MMYNEYDNIMNYIIVRKLKTFNILYQHFLLTGCNCFSFVVGILSCSRYFFVDGVVHVVVLVFIKFYRETIYNIKGVKYKSIEY